MMQRCQSASWKEIETEVVIKKKAEGLLRSSGFLSRNKE